MADSNCIVVRALKAMQADGVAVFSFFLPGSDVLELQTLAGLPVPTGS